MRVGILVTARLGSTRLKGKHLLQAGGQPLLSYLMKRICNEFRHEIDCGGLTVVLATSDEEENRAFETHTDSPILVFYGAGRNIPLRHLQAAEDYGLDAIIAVDGDDILCSVRAMRTLYGALLSGNKYLRSVGLPFGMNVLGYSTAYLETCMVGHHGEIIETGWGRIFSDVDLLELAVTAPVEVQELRFTLDYEEDYAFFKALIESLGSGIESATDAQIIETSEQNEFYRLNASVSNIYWENFCRCREQETCD